MVLVLPLALFDGALRHGSPPLMLRLGSHSQASCSSWFSLCPLISLCARGPKALSSALLSRLNFQLSWVVPGKLKWWSCLWTWRISQRMTRAPSFCSCMSPVTVACTFCLWCVRFLLFSFIPRFITSASVSRPLEAFKDRRKARVLEGCLQPQACIWRSLAHVTLWDGSLLSFGLWSCFPGMSSCASPCSASC